ncbi:MAG: aldo/keto reductase [Cyanobacteriota bacterium]
MKKYRLGKTNLFVSEIGFGGIPISRVSHEKAIKTIRRAIDLGINFIDTANGYVDSEEKIGMAIKNVYKREDLIIATKSTRRTKKELLDHIHNSLKLLQTDYIDLFQIHQVSKDDDIIRVFKEDGAYDTVLEAQKNGKIRHIGITSHRLEAAIQLVKTNKFETIQFPGNFVECNSFEMLFPEAQKRDIGCIIMKPLGGGELNNARLCFRYLQQYPEYIPIPGISEIEEIEEIVNLYENKEPITQEDLDKIEIIKKEVGHNFCRRCAYCEPCPADVKIFAAMAIPRLMRNYGNKYSAEWFLEGIKSVDKCVRCGLCEQRCPYSLPIRDTIQKNKEFYNKTINK